MALFSGPIFLLGLWFALSAASADEARVARTGGGRLTGPPARGTGFGMSAGDLPDLRGRELGSRLDEMKRLGIEWVRFDVRWSDVQPAGPGMYDWSASDRVVREANLQGLRVLGLLDSPPAWAAADGCSDNERCSPRSVEEFAGFAAAAAARYGPQGVTHWEIWNEPNSSGAWGPRADPAGYLRLLKATYSAVKAVDPSAVLLTGGLGVSFTHGGEISPQDFLTAVYRGGGRRYFDGVAHHAYSFPAYPGEGVDWSGWTQMLKLRAIMVSYGDGGKQVWATEYGAPTGGPGVEATGAHRRFDENPDHVSEAFQASLARQAVALWRSYSWAGPLFWYGYMDLGTDPKNNENFFGLVRPDGSHKPAYEEFEKAVTSR